MEIRRDHAVSKQRSTMLDHDLLLRHTRLMTLSLPLSPTLPPFDLPLSLPMTTSLGKRKAEEGTSLSMMNNGGGGHERVRSNGPFGAAGSEGHSDEVANELKRFRLDYAGPTTASTSINRAIPVSSNGQQQLASQLFSPAESINRPSPVSDPRSPFTNGTETVGQQSVVVGVGKMVDQSPVKPESAVVFSRERLKKLAASYREKGRALKHSSDKLAREATNPSENLIAIVQQTDAMLLFIFSFWCDDQAAKSCIVQHWQSIFGLISFVKSRAEKVGMSIIVGICLRIEAHIYQTLSNHEQKLLASKGSHLATSSAALPTPNSSVPTAPPSIITTPSATTPDPATSISASTSVLPPPLPLPLPPPPPPPPQPNEIVKSFVKASGELFRIQRQWDDSCVLLSPLILSTTLPRTWQLVTSTNVAIEQVSMIVPVKPFAFAWPVEASRSSSIPHVVAFSRALLEEYATNVKGLTFELGIVGE